MLTNNIKFGILVTIALAHHASNAVDQYPIDIFVCPFTDRKISASSSWAHYVLISSTNLDRRKEKTSASHKHDEQKKNNTRTQNAQLFSCYIIIIYR